VFPKGEKEEEKNARLVKQRMMLRFVTKNIFFKKKITIQIICIIIDFIFILLIYLYFTLFYFILFYFSRFTTELFLVGMYSDFSVIYQIFKDIVINHSLF